MNSLPRINKDQNKKTACSTMYNWVFWNGIWVFKLDTIHTKNNKWVLDGYPAMRSMY